MKSSFRDVAHKSPAMTDEQVCNAIHGMIEDIGSDHLDCRKQMFWLVSELTGLTIARLTSLFYGKGVKPSAVDYLTVRAAWRQMALDRNAAITRQQINQTRERINVAAPMGQLPDGTGELFEQACGSRTRLPRQAS